MKRTHPEDGDNTGSGPRPRPDRAFAPSGMVFEDPFGDDEFEEEEEEEVVENNEGEADVGMDEDMDEEGPAQPADFYRPGVDTISNDEQLVRSEEAYVMYHALQSEWPCLSFDIIPDKLGVNRTKFPLTAYMVAGTQAARKDDNKLVVMKVSDLHRTKYADDSEGEDSDYEDDPLVASHEIPHEGGINRVRVMPQDPHIVATWSELGRVNLYDVRPYLARIDGMQGGESISSFVSRTKTRKGKGKGKGKKPSKEQQIFSFKGHAAEGFAMDWSPVATGRLATGDCKRFIYVWDPITQTAGPSAVGQGMGGFDGGKSWAVDPTPFSGHSDSVEDLQWSPVEANVFASCSVDKTIKIWDVRTKQQPLCSVTAHDSDVNVISWNRSVNHLLVSGGDDGSFKVWDFRNFKEGQHVANFQWHTAPITSVEWHPQDESMIVVASADNSVTVWDMSLEADPDAALKVHPKVKELPPQLLFIHQGQTDVKEVHHHAQIPGAVFSTAFDGFNIFIPDIYGDERRDKPMESSGGGGGGGGGGW